VTAVARPVGRPRSPDLDGAILEATMVEYGLHGFDAMSVESVAARAGVGKATVYRRWSSKLALVAAALEHVGERQVIAETGTLAGDAWAVLRHLAALTHDPIHGAGLRHVVGDGIRTPELGEVHAAFVRGRRVVTKRLLQAAVERGELRADVDLDLAADVLAGPIFNRHLMTHLPVDEPFLAALHASFLRAFAT
jgi:AcrR family transcriptional regulator